MQVLGPLLFALLAAIGNALFAFGQRRSAGVDNSFVFITIALVICVTLCVVSAPFFGPLKASFVLYGVLSIVTTSVVVGAWLLREQLNLYHWLAVLCAVATVGLFSYGNSLR